jgi:hypothetical protein
MEDVFGDDGSSGDARKVDKGKFVEMMRSLPSMMSMREAIKYGT